MRHIACIVFTSRCRSIVDRQLLMLRRVLYTNKRAIYVAPNVSVVVEKTAQFDAVFNSNPQDRRVTVVGFHGSTGVEMVGRTQICVCTPEKAIAIVRKFLVDGRQGKGVDSACSSCSPTHFIKDAMEVFGLSPLTILYVFGTPRRVLQARLARWWWTRRTKSAICSAATSQRCC